jgi:hypothetical protein
MRKTIVGGALACALALPAGAAAEDEPSRSDYRNAAQYCKALKKQSGAQNFRSMFGGKRSAFGKCVSQTARREAAEDERQEEQARENAAEQCRAERAADPQAFSEKYGTNPNKRNAFGKCVSQKAREDKQEADEQDEAEEEAKLDAAAACKAERRADPDAFAEKYGTNRNKRNAFGKCVSQNARAGESQDD